LARFISKYREYSVVARRTIDRETAFQMGVHPQVGIICDFRWAGGISPWEKEDALKKLNFLGRTNDEDVANRLSVYDTEIQQLLRKWDDKTREEVDTALRSAVSFGTDFIEVEHPKAPVPWPNYPKIRSAAKIAGRVVEDGYDTNAVLAYELENENRPDVIAALHAINKEPEPEPLIAA